MHEAKPEEERIYLLVGLSINLGLMPLVEKKNIS